MADTTTTAYGLTKPEIGASEDTWGTKINTDLDTLDTVVNAIGGKTAAATLSYADAAKIATTATGVDVTGNVVVSGTVDGVDIAARDAILTSTTVTADAALPKAGGTMTGALDVQGTVTADGLTVDKNGIGGVTIQSGGTSGTAGIRLNATDSAGNSGGIVDLAVTSSANAFGALTISTRVGAAVTKRALFDSNGDISFYEDTGTTPKFFWDASAESLGIGTSSPSSFNGGANNLVVGSGSGSEGITIYADNASNSAIFFADTDSTTTGQLNYQHASNAMTFHTNGGAERLRIDSSGNVGIGTSSINAKLKIETTTAPATADGTNSALRLAYDGGGAPNSIGAGVTFAQRYSTTDGGNIRVGSIYGYKQGGDGAFGGGLLFYSQPPGATDQAERMRIDSYGNVLINKTSAFVDEQFTCNGGSTRAAAFGTDGTSNFICISIHNGNGAVGSITTSGSATSYNTSSDYRLKTDAQPMTGASARVQALNPVNFEWLSDGTCVDGFLAHEAQAVVPEAVTGTKDAMRDEEYEVTPAVEATYDDDGNELTAAVEAVMGTRSVPDMQGIDQSKLVPLLTAALQEALTEITALKARVTALEG